MVEYAEFHGFISICCLCAGMPYPQNLETAKTVEAIVRENGAVPATIAILDGVPCIGVSLKVFLGSFLNDSMKESKLFSILLPGFKF